VEERVDREKTQAGQNPMAVQNPKAVQIRPKQAVQFQSHQMKVAFRIHWVDLPAD
jgi:hypothetical protein